MTDETSGLVSAYSPQILPSSFYVGSTAGDVIQWTGSTWAIDRLDSYARPIKFSNNSADPTAPGDATFAYLYKLTGNISPFWRTSSGIGKLVMTSNSSSTDRSLLVWTGTGAATAIDSGIVLNTDGSLSISSVKYLRADASGNTSVGRGALSSLSVGTGLVAIGRNAGSTTTSGGNCILIGDGVTASGATASGEIVIGNSSHTSFKVNLAAIPVYADNAAALTGGLTAGMFYRSGASPDVLNIVH
jgi:hypothetical protein